MQTTQSSIPTLVCVSEGSAFARVNEQKQNRDELELNRDTTWF